MNHFDRKKAFALTIVICFGLVVGYFAYKRFSLSEEEAKKAVLTFYQMSKAQTVDKSIYPSRSQIDLSLILKKDLVINDISKNPETGMYDVYTEYIYNESYKYPIVFNVEKKNGIVQIKSSKGLCYHLYNGVFDLGVALNKIDPKATDVEISKAIIKESLQQHYKSLESMEMILLNIQLKLSTNISSSYINVLLKNESEYDLNYDDVDCKIEFLDNYGNIINSKKVNFTSTISAKQTTTASMFYPRVLYDFDTYQVTGKIVKTDNIIALLKETILSNIREGKVVIKNGEISYLN